jgi:hypothetical protein
MRKQSHITSHAKLTTKAKILMLLRTVSRRMSLYRKGKGIVNRQHQTLN